MRIPLKNGATAPIPTTISNSKGIGSPGMAMTPANAALMTLAPTIAARGGSRSASADSAAPARYGRNSRASADAARKADPVRR